MQNARLTDGTFKILKTFNLMRERERERIENQCGSHLFSRIESINRRTINLFWGCKTAAAKYRYHKIKINAMQERNESSI